MYLDDMKEQCETNQALRELMAFDPPKPCTEAEVRFLQRVLGLVLPRAYTEFLLWMGHGGGTLLSGSRMFYDYLVPIQEGARKLMQEGEGGAEDAVVLPADAYVVALSNHSCWFFRVSEGDDPPMYLYARPLQPARRGEITRQLGGFSDFLRFWIGGAAVWWEMDKDAAMPF